VDRSLAGGWIEIASSSATRRGRDQYAPGHRVRQQSFLGAGEIEALLERHPPTVRRWIGRFSAEGVAGLADRPHCGRPRLGGRRLGPRITALLQQPGPWTVPRIRRYLGRPVPAG
jgi:hypothetical protein